MSISLKSGCKINLLLNILGRRPDGFHELETLLHPVNLHDEIELEIHGDGIRLTSDHPGLACDDSNLVHKAAAAFIQEQGKPDGIRIHLRKRIPMEAGLGGGSANAAITLLGLNQLTGNPLASGRLQHLAAGLGSDVPFFLQPNPALAAGRGESIVPLAAFPAFDGLWMLLVHPGFGISTAWSYKTLAEFPGALNGQPGRARRLAEALRTNQVNWPAQIYNSLEFPAFRKYPVLQLYVEQLKELGARASLMSGSGSTVFAIFPSQSVAEVSLEKFRSKFGKELWSAILPLNQTPG